MLVSQELFECCITNYNKAINFRVCVTSCKLCHMPLFIFKILLIYLKRKEREGGNFHLWLTSQMPATVMSRTGRSQEQECIQISQTEAGTHGPEPPPAAPTRKLDQK